MSTGGSPGAPGPTVPSGGQGPQKDPQDGTPPHGDQLDEIVTTDESGAGSGAGAGSVDEPGEPQTGHA